MSRIDPREHRYFFTKFSLEKDDQLKINEVSQVAGKFLDLVDLFCENEDLKRLSKIELSRLLTLISDEITERKRMEFTRRTDQNF